jgi:2',3'-cyclic-nucleotide 2'-phosphodiesterase (5'-nucleotidase family)
MKTTQFFFFLFSAAVIASCKASYVPERVIYTGYAIQGQRPTVDSSMLVLLKPYADSVNRSMNDVIGIVETTLEKQQPQGSLGNLMADALLLKAREKFNTRVQLAIINYGGIRLPQLPAGPLTRGKVYELMPFDNALILQQLKGSLLQHWFDFIAAKGGWPIAGASFIIQQQKATQVLINGKPIDNNATYTVAHSDYLANGGDGCTFLTAIPQQNIGYLMRDALLEYFTAFTVKGQNIRYQPQTSVSYGE